MKRYNKDKRATYNTHINKRATYEPYNRHKHGTRELYDGYKRTIYVADTPATQPHIKTDNYISVENMKRVFTDEPRVYKATMPYKKYVICEPEPPITRPIQPTLTPIYKRERAKCVIYDHTGTRILGYDIFIREMLYDRETDTLDIHLIRGDRRLKVYPYMPATDNIYGVPTRDLHRYEIECYHI